MKIDGETVTFSTGTVKTAFNGIINIDHDCRLSSGHEAGWCSFSNSISFGDDKGAIWLKKHPVKDSSAVIR